MSTRPQRIAIGIVAGSVLVSVVAAVGLWVFGRIAFPPERVTDGRGYASQIGKWPQSLVQQFPKVIPPEATGVRLYHDDGFGPSHTIALRMIVPRSSVDAAVHAAKSSPGVVPPGLRINVPFRAENLLVIDDEDPSTPLPPGFQFFLLAATNENFAHLAANPDTGEMVYWATIH